MIQLIIIIQTKISYAKNIIRNIISYTYAKPITRKIMDDKIDDNKFDNMNDGYGAIENWNTSRITDMSYLFGFKKNFNKDVLNWDVSKVTDMSDFVHKFNFSQNKWNVSKVTNKKIYSQSTIR